MAIIMIHNLMSGRTIAIGAGVLAVGASALAYTTVPALSGPAGIFAVAAIGLSTAALGVLAAAAGVAAGGLLGIFIVMAMASGPRGSTRNGNDELAALSMILAMGGAVAGGVAGGAAGTWKGYEVSRDYFVEQLEIAKKALQQRNKPTAMLQEQFPGVVFSYG